MRQEGTTLATPGTHVTTPDSSAEQPRQAPAALLDRPVRVDAPSASSPTAPSSNQTATIAVVIVTWNRRDLVTTAIRSVAAQTYPAHALDVFVIDNSSTDGTLEHLVKTFHPERIVDNQTDRADAPRFAPPLPSESVGTGGPNTLGFGSLTIVRNTHNHGGCGGFNTGFAAIDTLSRRRPAFVWLADDDAEFAPDALQHLTQAMNSSPDVGVVGSRMVDLRDRTTTIESTIYFDPHTGGMNDNAPAHHPRAAAHKAWIDRVGSPKGKNTYTGTMDVDVACAASLLARWDAVVGGPTDRGRVPVGFWDARYFIYCDDADWGLRFGKAGWRVVLSLDAVVYHTPWNLKLTPARIYYAQRNRIWMGQKILPPELLRPVTSKALSSILKDSLRAAFRRRAFHSRIILDTARDAVIGRAGKTGSDGPAPEPVYDALARTGALKPGARIAVLCSHPESLTWLAALKAHIAAEAAARSQSIDHIRWIPIVRNDVPGHESLVSPAIIYGKSRLSRLKKQLHVLRARPTIAVVFEQTNDFPLHIPGICHTNIHIDQKKPTHAQVERDGWRVRLAFLAAWLPTALECWWWGRTLKPYVRTGRYG